MAIEFDVQIDWKKLYNYLLYVTYTSAAGLIGTAIGAALIGAYFWQKNALLMIAGILIILYIPWTLFQQALRQAKQEIFQKPLHYALSDEGITISQGETEERIPWDDIYKVTSTTNSLYIHMNKKAATIWPKADLGEKKEAVIAMISTHISPDRNKIKE